jgi:hypothetical protein
MAEVTPPPQGSSTAHTVGVAIGVVVGVLGSIFGAAVFILSQIGYPSGSTCVRNLPVGLGELAVVAIVLAGAWYLDFRVKGSSFGLGFARGLATGAGLMALIPWPCSVGFWAVQNLTCVVR